MAADLSWKQQLAVASLVALPTGLVVRLLIPAYFANLDPGVPFEVGLGVVLGFFFLPFLWWRSRVGYVGAVLVGILGVVSEARAVAAIAAADALLGEFYLIIVPTFVFSVLLVGSSVLAWREV